jgi:hypothetical protein
MLLPMCGDAAAALLAVGAPAFFKRRCVAMLSRTRQKFWSLLWLTPSIRLMCRTLCPRPRPRLRMMRPCYLSNRAPTTRNHRDMPLRALITGSISPNMKSRPMSRTTKRDCSMRTLFAWFPNSCVFVQNNWPPRSRTCSSGHAS